MATGCIRGPLIAAHIKQAKQLFCFSNTICVGFFRHKPRFKKVFCEKTTTREKKFCFDVFFFAQTFVYQCKLSFAQHWSASNAAEKDEESPERRKENEKC